MFGGAFVASSLIARLSVVLNLRVTSCLSAIAPPLFRNTIVLLLRLLEILTYFFRVFFLGSYKRIKKGGEMPLYGIFLTAFAIS